MIFAQSVTPPGAKLVAASMAMVGERVVSLRDTQIATELQKVLGRIKVSDWAVELDPVSQAILDVIAANEAKSFQLLKVTDQELEEGIKKVKSSRALNDFAIKENVLRNLVSEKIQSEKFLLLRSEGLKVVVSDQEVREYFEKHKSRYTSMPFEKYNDVIRKDLELEERQKRFLEWFEVLKQKYKVRIYGEPGQDSRQRG